MVRRLSSLSAVAVMAVLLVAVPTTAARLITGKDVKDSSLTGADVKNSSLTGTDVKDGSLTGTDVKDGSLTGTDVKDSSITGADVSNGSITAADLAAGIGSAPVTPYLVAANVAPPYASTFSPSAGTPTVEITTTRAGDVLLLSATPLTVTASASGPVDFTLGLAIFVDGLFVPGTASIVPSVPISEEPPFVSYASNAIGLNGIVIPDLAAGVHDIEVRLWHPTGSSAASNGSFQSFTVVELG
jgi:hypothetical protein